MELQLGLALPTPNMVKGFDLNNHGLDQLKEMGGLEAWNKAAGCFADKDCVKSKRSFEQAFGNFTEECRTKPLLLWSGQPNEEEDHKDQKKATFSTTEESIYVKVKMEGVAITRKIDIKLHQSYQSLTNSLITMFAKDKKCDEDDYILTYQDKEGDWLIAGDIPWQNFVRSVQRMEIVRNWG
ncbi:hypothetical protein GOBAR_DD23841 [Gossypium barbadense]|nr:hypothetical protein GOBAR_DD23841 [Gossypium barbadense]